ncbi:MAG: NAD(P)H-binding protein [Hahellaceae bacterium]|nr:NAD(P)H-binding protein [Hahellaceae bacterium]
MSDVKKTALVLGGTGLVGGICLRQLLESGHYDQVVAVTRRKLQLAHSHLRNIVSDFSDIEELMSGVTVDDVFCCLGTTIKKAGSREAFEYVDYELPITFARTALAYGARQFLLVSALGANADSFVFYNRVKGRLEKELIALKFPRTVILRPSLLDGEREELRFAETASLWAFKCAAPLLGRMLSGVKPVKANSVASCLVTEAQREMAAGEAVLRIDSEAISRY